MSNKDIVVLIPTLNEAKAIGQTIDDVLKHVPGCRILVLDSYSENGTTDIVLGKGAIVLDAPRGGKGKAVRSSLPYILSKYKAKCYVMMDGDFTYPAQYITSMVMMLKGNTDVVIGYRSMKESKAMTLTNTFGNMMLSMWASLLYGVSVKDVCSGMWGFRRNILSKFNISSDGFTLEADLFVNTVRNKCRLEEIPIGYRVRPDCSAVKLSVADGFKIAWFLARKRFSFKIDLSSIKKRFR